jgi:hypothetical protein
LAAKSVVSVIAATSATLAARGGRGSDFGCLQGYRGQPGRLPGVEILLRMTKGWKIARTCGSQPAGDDNFIIKTGLTDLASSLAG